MQIPYDIEFVESRPVVPVYVTAGAKRPRMRSAELPPAHDAIDRLLQWAFRVLRRFESRN